MNIASSLPAVVGLTKLASTFVVSAGAGTIVKTGVNMVKPHIVTGMFPTFKKISVTLGAAALGRLAADATSTYMSAQIDDYVKIAGFVADSAASGLEGAAKIGSAVKESVKDATDKPKDESDLPKSTSGTFYNKG